MAQLTGREAIRAALEQEMARDEQVVLLGEDIAVGGVFKTTPGLVQRFGADRVWDTPICEQAIVGSAMGAAMGGLRPVAEIMFSDFYATCWDLVANEIAKTRYMTGGQVRLPLVVRGSNGGGGLGFGAQHSQSAESWAMCVPGLKIACPSTPADMKGLLAAAIREDDPVLVFEHKGLYPKTGEVPESEHVVALGEAAVVRAGTDVTLVGLAFTVQICEAAADQLAEEGISEYKPFYKPVVSGKIHWVRPIFEGVVYALQNATDRPFKFSLLGPAQQSVIVHDEHYGGDQVAMATDIAVALNQELLYLQEMGLEAVQLIDVLPPYTQDSWQIEVQNRMFEGITMTKIWHICYGGVDGQTDVWENKAVDMMPLFSQTAADVIHLEFSHRDFAEIGAFREFPTDKVLGIGVIDSKDTQVETPDVVADRIRRAIDVVPADRVCVMTDCGLGYFSRTMAYAKLKAMCDGRDQVVHEISGAAAPQPVGAA